MDTGHDHKSSFGYGDSDFFVVDVTLDSGIGRKIVTVSSSVSFYNNLGTDLVIGFLLVRAENQPEDLMSALEKKQLREIIEKK